MLPLQRGGSKLGAERQTSATSGFWSPHWSGWWADFCSKWIQTNSLGNEMQQMTLGLMIELTRRHVLLILNSQLVSTHNVPAGNISECVMIPLPTSPRITHTRARTHVRLQQHSILALAALQRQSRFPHGAERCQWTLAGKVLTAISLFWWKDSNGVQWGRDCVLALGGNICGGPAPRSCSTSWRLRVCCNQIGSGRQEQNKTYRGFFFLVQV